MSGVGQSECFTEKCVVAFPGYWSDRKGNGNDKTRALKLGMMQELLTGRTRLV